MHLIVRLVLGLAARLAAVFAIDRVLWPGTLVSGAIGVVVAVAIAILGATRRAAELTTAHLSLAARIGER